MMIWILVMAPVLSGLAAFVTKSNGARRFLLAATAVFHLGWTLFLGYRGPVPLIRKWVLLDEVGLLFLGITSLLFLAASLYAMDRFRRETHQQMRDFEEGILFVDAPEARFTGCLLLFLATMTLVCVSRHFGLQWVAIEATTLASAPLIYYHRHHRSLEAAWKYLVICSVGIALALIGLFFLEMATSEGDFPIQADVLTANARTLSIPWLKAAFIFFLVGYGTKMGLAPLHTWLPDAHSEAPSLVSALLSGALLNCAFLAILRVLGVCQAAGLASFAQGMILGFGLLSMGIAAIFILGQRDFKRMLAYSSIEHMGILGVGVGLGGIGVFGAMLHALNHSLAKGMLFFTAGNILERYRSKSCEDVAGLSKALPISGVFWMAGFLAITGSPPFGLFISEFTILKAALDGARWGIAAAYLVGLAVVFIGLAAPFLRMVQGESRAGLSSKTLQRESWLSVFSPAVLGVLVLGLGIYLPPSLIQMLEEAARKFGGD